MSLSGPWGPIKRHFGSGADDALEDYARPRHRFLDSVDFYWRTTPYRCELV